MIKNWAALSATSQTILEVQRVAGGHELTMDVVMEGGDERLPLISSSGGTRVAYRRPSDSACNPSRLAFAKDGHWIGAQDVGSVSTYVYQPEGRPPEEAVILPINNPSQRQAAGADVFSAELVFAAGLRIFDRVRGKVFSAPPALSTTNPRVTPSAVFFTQAQAVDDPTGWVWDRTTGEFRELVGAGADVVADLRGDGETIVWVEAPFPGGQGSDPGVLYTSPFTTDPEAIIATARWSNIPIPPGSLATMGGGYYAAVGESTRSIYILRLSDGRRWTIAIPDDEFASPVKSFPYIDEDLLFVVTETQLHRIHMDALGPGMPSE